MSRQCLTAVALDSILTSITTKSNAMAIGQKNIPTPVNESRTFKSLARRSQLLCRGPCRNWDRIAALQHAPRLLARGVRSRKSAAKFSFWKRCRIQCWQECPTRGTWCSGITSASHAEGPGFKSQCVHFKMLRAAYVHTCLIPRGARGLHMMDTSPSRALPRRWMWDILCMVISVRFAQA